MTVYEDLDAALVRLDAFRFTRSSPDTTSAVPGGRFAHGLVDRAVGRQVDALLRQSQAHADDVADAVRTFAQLAVQQIDDLQREVADLRRSVNELRLRGDVVPPR